MFDEVFGLPAHALLVHAPVVLAPLLVLAVLVYVLVPRVRQQVTWAVVAMAVAAPLSAVGARQSGVAHRDRLYPPQALTGDHPVEIHAGYGNLLMWSSLGLGVVTLVLVWLRRGDVGVRRLLGHVLSAVAVLLAVVVAFYTVRVGHTGAELTHGV